MDFELYTAFILACICLGLIPGPNVALIVANSLAHGTRYGIYSLLGSSSAMIPQLTIVTLGLSTIAILMSGWFEILRWIGVAYLVYLGFKYWTAPPDDLDADPKKLKKPEVKKIYLQGLATSATNPKTLMFFGAFLPQFVAPGGNVLMQMTVLSATLIVAVGLVDTGWAVLAGAARPLLTKLSTIRNKISGVFFFSSGLGLALAKHQ